MVQFFARHTVQGPAGLLGAYMRVILCVAGLGLP